jgi:hypothetical protein
VTAFGAKQIADLGAGITQAIVAWDPETATEAEIEEMIKELDKITIEAGKAKTEYDKEQREANAVQLNFDRHIAAAEILEKQLNTAQTGSDLVQADELRASIERLLSDLEQIKPELAREIQETEEAKEFYYELSQLAKVTADKVRKARNMLQSAQRDMKRAEVEQQRAAARAAKAEKVAGLRKDAGEFGVALASMNKRAEEARAKAAASDLKAKLLSPQADNDAHIEAALKAATFGARLTPASSVAERIAALKQK